MISRFCETRVRVCKMPTRSTSSRLGNARDVDPKREDRGPRIKRIRRKRRMPTDFKKGFRRSLVCSRDSKRESQGAYVSLRIPGY